MYKKQSTTNNAKGIANARGAHEPPDSSMAASRSTIASWNLRCCLSAAARRVGVGGAVVGGGMAGAGKIDYCILRVYGPQETALCCGVMLSPKGEMTYDITPRASVPRPATSNTLYNTNVFYFTYIIC